MSLSIVDGWFPLVLTALGLLAFAWLIIYPRPRYLFVVVPAAIVVAVGGTLAARYVIENVWRPFPEPIENVVYVAGGFILLAVLLTIARLIVGHGVLQTALTVLAGLVAVTLGTAQINISFAAYPTVAALFGDEGGGTITLDQLGDANLHVVPINNWRAPSGMPTDGSILTAPIPGAASGFTARPAKIYLPPAALTSPAPRLPVLVLMAGQPGSPEDWLLGGQLVSTMDGFARTHRGLTPIVVVADATGTELANPLCVDSQLGNVATYLTKDVPAWVRENLKVADTARTKWAAGGLSYGGTCSLQLATNYPKLYPTFLDISGQLEPTLGSRQRTVDIAFGGDADAFRAVNPMDLMATRQYPDSAGAFVVGAGDTEYKAGVRATYEAAKRAGMDVHYTEVPGGHTFAVWSAGLRKELPWLAKRLGIPE